MSTRRNVIVRFDGHDTPEPMRELMYLQSVRQLARQWEHQDDTVGVIIESSSMPPK